jgi:glycosyltransferase involved in cell wall biosynthesis
MADVPERYGERLLIYHIVDEYAGYARLEPERARDMARRERELIERADLVLVTSEALLQSKGDFNVNTHWVPNGVDYAAYAEASRRKREPERLAQVPRPRIGYIGAINDKIDTALLLAVARAHTEASLVLVGPVRLTARVAQREAEALQQLTNVHLIGRVPGEAVADYVAACDVGLLPYRQNEWTRHIHPLKLYEYLACGLPVVSTDLPSVRCEAEWVTIAPDTEAFVAAVGAALTDHDGTQRARRQARAAENTWDHRVERISSLILATEAAR